MHCLRNSMSYFVLDSFSCYHFQSIDLPPTYHMTRMLSHAILQYSTKRLMARWLWIYVALVYTQYTAYTDDRIYRSAEYTDVDSCGLTSTSFSACITRSTAIGCAAPFIVYDASHLDYACRPRIHREMAQHVADRRPCRMGIDVTNSCCCCWCR